MWKPLELLTQQEQKTSIVVDSPIFDYIQNQNSLVNNILWLSNFEIIWEWDYSITILNPFDDKKIIKIPKKWYEKQIIQEYDNHKRFYNELKKIKNTIWNSEFGQFEIPEVYEFWLFWGYEMQRIQWQNIATKFYLDYYKEQLKEYNEKFLNSLSDNQIRNLLMDKWLELVAENQEDIEELYFWNTFLPLEEALLKYWDSWKIVKKIIKELNKQWLKYWDLQPRNFMIWNDWKIYIIDFWVKNK